MKYARFNILADMPQEKTICVEFETSIRATQVCSVMVNNARQPSVLVTVIIKNARLMEADIKTIAHEYVLGKLSPSGGFFNTL